METFYKELLFYNNVGDLINQVNFGQGVDYILRKSIVIGHFMTQKTVSMTFCNDHGTRNFFFTGKSVFFHSMNCLLDSGSLL